MFNFTTCYAARGSSNNQETRVKYEFEATKLHDSVQAGDWKQVLAYAKQYKGKVTNARNAEGLTPLHVLVSKPEPSGNELTAADVLLEFEADLTAKTPNGLTALAIAKEQASFWVPFLEWHIKYFTEVGKLAKDAVVE